MKLLLSRLGGIGDCLIITPLIRYLHQQGNEIYLITSEQGDQIFKHNPHIAKLKVHERNSIPNSALGDYFESIQQAWECEKHIGLSESLEVNLALYPSSPRYKYTKQEKMAMCNKNYYEETFEVAGINSLEWMKHFAVALPTLEEEKKVADMARQDFLNPEIFFSPEEEKAMDKFWRQFKDKFLVLVGLSGSGRCKIYPYYEQVFEECFKQYPNMVFITTGDDLCQILEKPFAKYERVICKSGQWSIRESILACKYADLVIAPDTGLLHGAGCFDTPKIGLLTHTTIENITKHFKNDYSIECDHETITCSPCFQLHYSSKLSCNFDTDKYTPLCQKYGIPPERVLERINQCQK